MSKHARTAAKRDANEPDIIKALEDMGATVTQLDQPVDLLISYESAWVLMEVKNDLTAYGRAGMNSAQEDWAAKQKAVAHLVYTPEQAVDILKRSANENLSRTHNRHPASRQSLREGAGE